MHEKILDFLKKKEDYISGEEISSHLAVSRQALWKHIQELREAGYDIVAVPHLGYRLAASPDRLFPFEISRQLNTKVIGKKIHYFETVGSTMDTAMKMGAEGAAEGTVIVAETQTRGRGRLGRSWLSPKYKGIYFSLLLRPKISPNFCSLLTLLSAVSICEAIQAKTGLDMQIKWPNDILLSQKKIGGILTELNAEMDETNFVVIGVGLNVNNDKKNLLPSATSLREHKDEAVDRIGLLQEILRSLEENYFDFLENGSRSLLGRWRSRTTTIGRMVKVASAHSHLEGEAVDIDEDGGLLIRQDTGLLAKVMAGDITYCR